MESNNTRKKKRIFTIICAGIASIVLISQLVFKQQQLQQASLKAASTPISNFEIIKPTLKYGFALDTFFHAEEQIKPNEFLADILLRHKVDYLTIDELARETKGVFDVRNLRAGNKYMILAKDSSQAADYFIYEPSVYRYVVYDLKEKKAEIVERPIATEIRTASGVIESSLWNTMTDNGLSYELTARMEDAFAWSIDFHHIQRNDQFKLVFEQQYINGQPVGVGDIHAAYFKNFDNEYYAIYFENDKHNGFYDLEARPMKKAFLKSPVKYSRISSRYNLRRFHPVLRRRKAHLGTDYAAPRGTPIYAVADGIVTKASRTRGNGNYVKIKHDKVYQTQYLHMQRFAKGIHPGVHVKQGQTIGYVGSTGLATGPHVCFRFWKNGRQVNHLRENLPPPDPMPEEDVPAFVEVKNVLKAQLDEIPLPKAMEGIAQQVVKKDSVLSEAIIEQQIGAQD
ncbi:MAG: peptidoglycan DD-metalloendopeptidase family protein [Bacteroidota bacterium]